MGEKAPVSASNLVCVRCGSRQFWDNASRKRSGQFKPNAPDLTCVRCRKGRWLPGPRRELTEPEPLPKNLPPPIKVQLPEGRPETSPFFQ